MKQANVLVCGDFMFDTYTIGSVERISPEAPVPVMRVSDESSRPGGAGNVALNLLSLGMNVFVAGRVGDDPAGEALSQAFASEGIQTNALLKQEGYITPKKNRLLASGQQLLRMDTEEKSIMSDEFETKLLQTIASFLSSIDIIAISDYAKGAITHSFCSNLIELARSLNIPVIVDPKGTDFSKYQNATLIKPNKLEAIKAAHLTEEATLDEIGQELIEQTHADYIMITRSEEGISLYGPFSKICESPVKSKEVVDVTGAGDTVLACITMALANNVQMEDALQIANCAASIAIEHIGCHRVTFSQISKRLLQSDTDNKIFSEVQISALEQVLQKNPYTLIVLEDVEKLTLDLFSEMNDYRSVHPNHHIVVYIKADAVRGDIVSLLSSFRAVDFIIEQTDCMQRVIDAVRPNEVLLWEEYGLVDRTPSVKLLTELLETSQV